MLAGFDALLFRLSGQVDVVIVIPTAGQSAQGITHRGGHCVNALPVRTVIDVDAPFSTLVLAARGALLDA